MKANEGELGLLGEEGLQERLFILCWHALVLGHENVLEGIIDNSGCLEEPDFRLVDIVGEKGHGVEIGANRLHRDNNNLGRFGVKGALLGADDLEREGIQLLLDFADCVDHEALAVFMFVVGNLAIQFHLECRRSAGNGAGLYHLSDLLRTEFAEGSNVIALLLKVVQESLTATIECVNYLVAHRDLSNYLMIHSILDLWFLPVPWFFSRYDSLQYALRVLYCPLQLSWAPYSSETRRDDEESCVFLSHLSP